MLAPTVRSALAALAIISAVILLGACGTPEPDATPGSGDKTFAGGPNTGVGTPGSDAGTPARGEGTPANDDGGTPGPSTTPDPTVTKPAPGPTIYAIAPPGVMMIAGTASAGVGANATVTITLEGVPLPGIIGYHFDIDYDDSGLSRQSGTTAECKFDMIGISPVETGGPPYAASCLNSPAPATPRAPCNAGPCALGALIAACSPGPCLLATIVFRCETVGKHALTFDSDPDPALYADLEQNLVAVPVQSGRVTCT